MTNSLFRKQRFLLIAALFVCASAAFAQTTSMNLTGTGDNATVYDGGSGVYVDPYTATVGGVSNVSVICDDWSNNSYVGESWTANVTTLNSLNMGTNASTPLFGNNPTLYNEVAWLGTQLLANPTNYANQVAVSFALWELTYAYNNPQESPDPTSFLAGSAEAGSQNTVNTLLSQATTAVAGGYNGNGWEILTPIAGTVSNPSDEGIPQEFLVYAPESSSMILFGADTLGLLALAFVFRRRLLVPVS
jgi:hypothetical protein